MRKNGFFAMMTRMRNITRWGLMRNNITENLTEHSYDTAVTAHALAVIGKEKFGKDIDPGQIAAVALFHDASEIITGDMPTPVKYNNPEIQAAYKSIEHAASQSLCGCYRRNCSPSTRCCSPLKQIILNCTAM